MLTGYPRRTATRGAHTGQYAARRALCRLARVCAKRLYVLLQALELLVTVLLARNRQPPPTVAAGVPHAKLAAELVTLPSGLLAMVCAAIVKLTVRLGAAGVRACVRVRVGCTGRRRGPTRSRLSE